MYIKDLIIKISRILTEYLMKNCIFENLLDLLSWIAGFSNKHYPGGHRSVGHLFICLGGGVALSNYE